MIGKIKGILIETDQDSGLIETQSGISYRVYLTKDFLYSKIIPTNIEVYTYHHIREDTQRLYGFQAKIEFQLFTYLLKVSSVGPKTAFNILCYARAEDVIKAIRTNDKDFLVKIKGLGKKTAYKIILELSSVFDSEFIFKSEKPISESDQTVIDALQALDFNKMETKKILDKIPINLSTEEKIKAAIVLLTNK